MSGDHADESACKPSAFTACFILASGGPHRERILTEIRCYIDFHAAVNPLSRGPILAIDIPRHDMPISDSLYAGELAQMLHKLPCGVLLEWLVPRRDAPRAFGLYAGWDEMAAHPDLVDLDRAAGGDA
jgi:hypothetical protein